jgi:hypothetical protein
MVAVFDPTTGVPSLLGKGLDGRGLGTEAVFGADQREVGVSRAELDQEAFGSVACPVMFARAIVFDDGCRPQRNDRTKIWMDHRRP